MSMTAFNGKSENGQLYEIKKKKKNVLWCFDHFVKRFVGLF